MLLHCLQPRTDRALMCNQGVACMHQPPPSAAFAEHSMTTQHVPRFPLQDRPHAMPQSIKHATHVRQRLCEELTLGVSPKSKNPTLPCRTLCASSPRLKIPAIRKEPCRETKTELVRRDCCGAACFVTRAAYVYLHPVQKQTLKCVLQVCKGCCAMFAMLRL